MERTSQKGKKAEFLVFAELIGRGADLYLPVIDTGIDAIILKKDGTHLKIQMKATQADDQAGYFNVGDIDKRPEDKFFIICVDMNEKKVDVGGRPNIWILSARKFKEFMTSGNRLPIYDRSQKHDNKRRCELLQDNFEAWGVLTG